MRLVAASARAQGLAGTDHAAAGASLAGIGDGWTATLREATAEHDELVPGSAESSTHSRTVRWVDRAHDSPRGSSTA